MTTSVKSYSNSSELESRARAIHTAVVVPRDLCSHAVHSGGAVEREYETNHNEIRSGHGREVVPQHAPLMILGVARARTPYSAPGMRVGPPLRARN